MGMCMKLETAHPDLVRILLQYTQAACRSEEIKTLAIRAARVHAYQIGVLACRWAFGVTHRDAFLKRNPKPGRTAHAEQRIKFYSSLIEQDDAYLDQFITCLYHFRESRTFSQSARKQQECIELIASLLQFSYDD